MSLRAKLEAVIYAADEPVTLAQLAVLFGSELAAEVETAEADAGKATPGPSADDLIAQELDPQEPAAQPAGEAIPVGQQALAAEANAVESGEATPEAPADPAREGRQRDRVLRERLRALLDELIAEYAGNDRGMEIREVAGGYRMSTKPEYHDAVRGFVKNLKPPMKLSLQALETLAVVAYKQPVTAPEISDIRGVESAGTLGSLIARKLITTAGRKHVIGRPILYKTTKEFLLRFGLRDLNELPSMEEFEKMAGDLSGDLNDTLTGDLAGDRTGELTGNLGEDLATPVGVTGRGSSAGAQPPHESGPRQNLAALAFPDANGTGSGSSAEHQEAATSEHAEEAETHS